MSDAEASRRVDSDETAAGFGDVRILRFLAPVALASLALLQLFLGQNAWLTPWKGGGYGMFSTPDGPSGRGVRVYLETAEREIPTRMPRWIRNQEKYVRSLPADFRLRAIAEEMAAGAWHYVPRKGYSDDGRRIEPVADSDGAEDDKEKEVAAYPPVSSRKPGDPPREDRVQIPLTGVRVEVWRRVYDRASDMLSIEKIAEARAKVPPK